MKMVRLGDHAKFLSGFAFKSALFNRQGLGLPIVRIRDINNGYSETFYSGDYDDRYLVYQGDYLIGMDGEFNLASWRSDTALLNQRVCKIHSLSEGVDLGYLAKFLPIALKEIESATPFVTVKHLSVKTINDIQIPLPPLAEQKLIAAILDAAEDLRAKRRETIALLDTLLQSVFLDMFGDPATNPMGWERKALGDVCKIVSGATPKTGNPAFWDGHVPWITPKDLSGVEQKYINDSSRKITDAGLQSCSANILPPYSVLFSSRAPIGLVAINTIPVCTNQGFKSMVPYDDIISPDYLYWWLRERRESIQQKGRGATFKEVSKKIVEALQIPLPPLDLQRRFAKIVESIENQKAIQRAHLAELDTLFASLQQRAFNGELSK